MNARTEILVALRTRILALFPDIDPERFSHGLLDASDAMPNVVITITSGADDRVSTGGSKVEDIGLLLQYWDTTDELVDDAIEKLESMLFDHYNNPIVWDTGRVLSYSRTDAVVFQEPDKNKKNQIVWQGALTFTLKIRRSM